MISESWAGFTPAASADLATCSGRFVFSLAVNTADAIATPTEHPSVLCQLSLLHHCF